MDILEMSVAMHQATLDNAVSTSVLKIALDSGSEQTIEMADMMDNIAVDTSRGMNIDVEV